MNQTSPIENVTVKEYRKILNLIRESVEHQFYESPFLSTNTFLEIKKSNHENTGEFCLKVLQGLKEKRKKFRLKNNVSSLNVL
jgi:hypothetical protein